jgi:GT2 family glycosyltransferase
MQAMHNKGVMVYIVFPVHNRIESTKDFLTSLSKQSAQNYKLVICDDGSTDGTGEYLSTHHPDVTVIQGTGQLWWTAGINKCVHHVLENSSDSDYILTLNNDILLPDNYIEQKLQRASEYPDAIIGTLCVYSDNKKIIETSGYVMGFEKCEGKRLTRPGEKRTEKHKGVVEVTHLPGKGVLLPVKVFKDIGLYDEVNLPQYHADTDLILRAHKAGYCVLVDFDSVIYSDVNANNMVLPTHAITLKGIVDTFRGPYSMNNFSIYNNFAKKHFPDRRVKYLLKTYFKIIGGLARRYLQYRLRRLKST